MVMIDDLVDIDGDIDETVAQNDRSNHAMMMANGDRRDRKLRLSQDKVQEDLTPGNIPLTQHITK